MAGFENNVLVGDGKIQMQKKTNINNLDGESEFDERFISLVAEDFERTDHETHLINKKQSELGVVFMQDC